MTAADHANTVREALEHPKTKWCSRCEADALNDPCVCGEPDVRDALAALDALQAQAEEQSEIEGQYRLASEQWRNRAEAAEADRDRLERKLAEAEERYEVSHRRSMTYAAERDRLRAALEKVMKRQADTLQWFKDNGIVFDGPLGTDPSNWEQIAFAVYTDLCEAETIARAALAETEQP